MRVRAMKVPITPETKVGSMLEAYPDLEAVLVAMAPAFAKLKNPMLRRTVARIATLEQAARIGGIPVRDLVRRLREAAGLPAGEIPGADPEAREAAGIPESIRQKEVRFRIDGDEMLERGIHPIGKVRECVARLDPGGTVLLVTSFRPDPLIETMRKSGLEVHSVEDPPGKHATYISRP
jgi:hypothetical protein